jgi:hypothetical protein
MYRLALSKLLLSLAMLKHHLQLRERLLKLMKSLKRMRTTTKETMRN